MALGHRSAAEASDLVAAVSGSGATLGRAVLDQLGKGRPVPIQILVGTKDAMFGRQGNLRGGTFLTAEDSAEQWARHNGAGPVVKMGDPVPFQRWPAAGANSAEVELWQVEGAGNSPVLDGGDWSTAQQRWQFLMRPTKPPQAGE